MKPPAVAFVTLATGRYAAFTGPLLASVRKHFLRGCDVTPIVLSDRPEAVPGMAWPIAHRPWPEVTLFKFGSLGQFRDRLETFDYVYLCDADMRFVNQVGEEVLGEVVAVRHPGFFNKPRSAFTYEHRPGSTAFIPPDQGTDYYAGGFLGGRSSALLDICAVIHARIEDDGRRKVVAVWHDESHWNRYLAEHPPTVALSPAYCYPEGWNLPFTPRLIALDKDHDTIRAGVVRGLALKSGRLLGRAAGIPFRAVRKMAGLLKRR
jgi:histo-blood group ABO system transferase